MTCIDSPAVVSPVTTPCLACSPPPSVIERAVIPKQIVWAEVLHEQRSYASPPNPPAKQGPTLRARQPSTENRSPPPAAQPRISFSGGVGRTVNLGLWAASARVRGPCHATGRLGPSRNHHISAPKTGLSGARSCSKTRPSIGSRCANLTQGSIRQPSLKN